VYRRLVPFALALLVAGCLDSQPSSTPTTSTSAGGHLHGGMNMSGGHDMYVIASDLAANPSYAWRFDHETYTFPLNAHINVTLSNANGNQYEHALVIDEFSVHLGPIEQSKAANASFHASKAGSFKFYCDVGNHRTLGMEGTLTITQ